MYEELIWRIEDIVPGYVYRLKIGDYQVRDMCYESFANRKASIVSVWISAQLLYRVTEDEPVYHQEKPRR